MKETIVSSTLKETWPNTGKLIFLGTWCRKYSEKKDSFNFESETVEYHWNDRLKFKNDVKLIESITEEYLEKISKILNSIHGSNESIRYWRILIGWWLTVFVQILFDRWFMANHAAQKYPNAEVLRNQAHKYSFTSKNTAEFVDQASNSECWNEKITSDIFEYFTKLKVNYNQTIIKQTKMGNTDIPSKSKNFIYFYSSFYKFIRKISPKALDLSLESTYLNRLSRFKLNYLTRTLPVKFLNWEIKDQIVLEEIRNWKFPYRDKSEFKDVLEFFIPIYLPTCFLEEYKINRESAEKVRQYFSPKTIVTANDFAGNEPWKFWAASCANAGSKLIIAQHGGLYGVAEYLSTQNYEISISDRFLTWGWTNQFEPKTIAAPAMRLLSMRKISQKSNKNCILTTMALPRRSYHLGSLPLGPQVEDYLNDQFMFVKNINGEVLSNLIIRLFPIDYGWQQELRWHNFNKNIKTNAQVGNMNLLTKSTKLFVSTYNSTTYLESFRRNIPTVLFWNPSQWEISEDAKPYFELLKNAKILFEDPKSAANHVNLIWNYVEDWWDSKAVSEAVELFSSRYAYVGGKPLSELKNAIQLNSNTEK